MNNEFERQYKRISKKHQGNFDEMRDELIEAIGSSLPHFPDDMCADIATYFRGDFSEESVKRILDLVDLHSEQLSKEHSVLTADDWFMIKNLVNIYAADLDMEWVTYVMQFILDMGVL